MFKYVQSVRLFRLIVDLAKRSILMIKFSRSMQFRGPRLNVHYREHSGGVFQGSGCDLLVTPLLSKPTPFFAVISLPSKSVPWERKKEACGRCPLSHPFFKAIYWLLNSSSAVFQREFPQLELNWCFLRLVNGWTDLWASNTPLQ